MSVHLTHTVSNLQVNDTMKALNANFFELTGVKRCMWERRNKLFNLLESLQVEREHCWRIRDQHLLQSISVNSFLTWQQQQNPFRSYVFTNEASELLCSNTKKQLISEDPKNCTAANTDKWCAMIFGQFKICGQTWISAIQLIYYKLYIINISYTLMYLLIANKILKNCWNIYTAKYFYLHKNWH